MSTFRVAPGRSLRLPATKIKKLVMPKGVIRIGEPGRLILSGGLLDESYITFAATKVEGNQQTLLANLLADGVVIEEN
jgi:hypothetical protein